MTIFYIVSKKDKIEPYTGPASGLAVNYKIFYTDLQEAVDHAAQLNKVNPIGFDVHELELKVQSPRFSLICGLEDKDISNAGFDPKAVSNENFSYIVENLREYLEDSFRQGLSEALELYEIPALQK